MDDTKQIIVRISPALHRKFKAFVAIRGFSIQGWLEKHIVESVKLAEESTIDDRLAKLVKGAGNGMA